MAKRSRLGSQLARVLGRALGQAGRRSHAPAPPKARGTAYPGDFLGSPNISYAPNPGNGNVADPGEIVWTWVPFEEDHSQGKDRPVLVIGRDGPWLLALPLTSKDHDLDPVQKARAGRNWTDIGVRPVGQPRPRQRGPGRPDPASRPRWSAPRWSGPGRRSLQQGRRHSAKTGSLRGTGRQAGGAVSS